MSATYCDSAEACALADALCRFPRVQSTLLSIALPLLFCQVLYLDGNLTMTARRDFHKMINELCEEKSSMSRSESIIAPLFPHCVSLAFGYEKKASPPTGALSPSSPSASAFPTSASWPPPPP